MKTENIYIKFIRFMIAVFDWTTTEAVFGGRLFSTKGIYKTLEWLIAVEMEVRTIICFVNYFINYAGNETARFAIFWTLRLGYVQIMNFITNNLLLLLISAKLVN